MGMYPEKAFVSDITNAKEAVVTFTADHDFSLGEIISFRVTRQFGMIEINQKVGKVIGLTSDTVTVDIDTSTWTPFDYSLIDTAGTSPPLCVPVGSGIIPGEYVPTINIEDAFDNRGS
jgi:hypothetical protein